MGWVSAVGDWLLSWSRSDLISLAAVVTSVVATCIAAKASKRSSRNENEISLLREAADRGFRPVNRETGGVAAVEWDIEYARGSTFLLRNVGRATAHDVRFLDVDSLPITLAPEGVELPIQRSHSFCMSPTYRYPMPGEIVVSWREGDRRFENAVPVP